MANLGFAEVAFPKPLFHGDTLYGETTVTDKRPSSSRPGEGVVTFEHVGRNQYGVVVAHATRVMLVRMRPDQAPRSDGATTECAGDAQRRCSNGGGVRRRRA